MNQKTIFQEIFNNLIKDHEITCNGEEIDPDIHDLTIEQTARINFDDEYMMHVLSGNVPCRVYDDMKKKLEAAGWEITDTDGCIMHLSKIS